MVPDALSCHVTVPTTQNHSDQTESGSVGVRGGQRSARQCTAVKSEIPVDDTKGGERHG